MKKVLLAGLATGLFLVGVTGVAVATSVTYNFAGSEYIFVTGTSSLTWDTAEADLVALSPGYHLASITSEAENAFIINRLTVLYSNPDNRTELWFGANITGGNITWADGTLSSSNPYTDWHVGEPNWDGNGGGVAMDYRSGLGWKWNDEGSAIGQIQGYIGEKTASPVPEPATMLLFGTGIAGLAAVARRKKK